MTELLAWVLFPLVMAALTAGLGLFLEWALRTPLSAALLVPVGFCAAIAIIGPIYFLGLGAWFAAVPLLILAIAGAVLGRARLAEHRRAVRLPLLVGAGSYGLFVAPVVLTGHATFLGYNFLNDTSLHLIFIQYLRDHGAHVIPLPPSSYSSAALQHVTNAYPFGSHELIATLDALIPTGPEHLYQPFLAICAGVAALAVYGFLTDAGAPRWAAALAAPVPMLSQLLFSYQLQGGLKELAMVAVLLTGAALGARLVAGGRWLGYGVMLGLVAAAGVGVYGLSAGAWLAPLALAIAVGLLVAGGRPARRRLPLATAAAAVVFAVFAAPLIVKGFTFVSYGKGALTGANEYGPLSGALRPIQAAGVWFNGDYRTLDAASPLGRRTQTAIGAVALLAILGLAFSLRRRLIAVVVFFATTLIAYLGVSRTASPYIDAKMLAILSPAVVLCACLGVAAMWQRRLRWEAAAAAVFLVACLGYSDLLAYRGATVAPMDRLEELTQVGDRFAGQGPMLVNEFEEYAKFFARKAAPWDPYEAWTVVGAQLRDPKAPVYANAYPLDELKLDFVKAFPLIALRRSPAESRPPDGYELAWRGKFYEVWRRARPTRALSHLPLDTPSIADPASGAAKPRCKVARAMGRRSSLAAVERPAATVVSFRPATLPGWVPDPGNPLGTIATAPGTQHFRSPPTGAGRYRVWLRGRFNRSDSVRVGGRTLDVPRHYNGPKQYLDLGTVTLQAGPQDVTFVRGPNTWAPGGFQGDLVGPLVLVPDRPEKLITVPRGKGQELCGKSLDWIEALNADGRP